ncbi:ATP-dependent DNA helicase [Neisseria gonorrhoeae]|uniref:ATP-dependent DNA helicase n=1 Tax=Neisseria gonorrhoeae TaxID=485 RepID=A0A378VVQ2_NEIGO|nr:ATP-dependent DNA helicase [Neisseria gonorrhoeae]
MPSERQNAVFRRHFPIPILLKQTEAFAIIALLPHTHAHVSRFLPNLSKDRHFLQSAFKIPTNTAACPKSKKIPKSHEIFLKRLAALPKPEFDDTLPVHENSKKSKNRCRNQVTIICGETGSGKPRSCPRFVWNSGVGRQD